MLRPEPVPGRSPAAFFFFFLFWWFWCLRVLGCGGVVFVRSVEAMGYAVGGVMDLQIGVWGPGP